MASFAATAVLLLLLADAFRRVADGGEASARWIGWLAVSLMLASAVLALSARRHTDHNAGVAIMWGFAITPFLFGAGAVLASSDSVGLMWIGLCVSVGLVAVWAWSIKRRGGSDP
jgi:hypothetical protein